LKKRSTGRGFNCCGFVELDITRLQVSQQEDSSDLNLHGKRVGMIPALKPSKHPAGRGAILGVDW
jgi:hypothetical protein